MATIWPRIGRLRPPIGWLRPKLLTEPNEAAGIMGALEAGAWGEPEAAGALGLPEAGSLIGFARGRRGLKWAGGRPLGFA